MQVDSTLQRLARTVLDQDPTLWATRLHDEGHSWQQIADQLAVLIDMPVSRETVRLWSTAAKKVDA